MPILKCKMCGGDLNILEGMTVCECEYCNTKQTVPTIENEKKVKLFDRANRLRMECQFDKAATVYESIIEEFDNDAEGYWGLLLCKYGIEYVDDPATGDKVPTCHRSSFDSFMDDKDFDMVMEYADAISRNVYREQAKQIEEIRKGIIEVSGKEEPYDIFICYKETAEDGQRTLDSVLAQDVYDILIEKGYRVFFSRITLEDKLGTEYEPYIFAALNSAIIMLAFGTSYDYYNAVWVKNEWSRYLKLMAKDKSKHLIPCYKDIDAYDIPKEFAKLQAQDLGKVGATQDLIRGIEKILPKHKEVVKETVAVQSGNGTSVEKMLERGNFALEDNDWQKADSFFEEALNQNPKCAEAYLGKLLAEAKCVNFESYLNVLIGKYEKATTERLYACDEETTHINSVVKENVLEGYLEADAIKKLYTFDRSYCSSLSCRKEQKTKQQSEIDSDKILARVRQYATGELKEQIESGLERLASIHDSRIAEEQKKDEAKVADVISNYQAHIESADKKARDLRVKADKKKREYYDSVVTDMNNAATVADYEKTRDKFRALGKYEDSSKFVKRCQSEIDRIKDEVIKERERLDRKVKRITVISMSAVFAVIAIIVIIVKVVVPLINYNKAITFKNNGQYREAVAIFKNLDGFKDSNEQMRNIKSSVEYISTLSVGESFYYGNYSDAPLEWTILDIQNNQIFAITTNVVEDRAYNDTKTDVTWETCSLRLWLNDDFYNEAFNSEEQSRIMATTVSPGSNPNMMSNPGETTVDKLFLLNFDEVKQYFDSENSRICGYGYRSWWLRSPGSYQYYAALVRDDGSIDYGGNYVDRGNCSVRPAMWIDIS